MKILLTGKNGQVGHALVPRLSALGTLCAVGTAECDFQDETALRTLVRRERPDVIVNPAAYTAVDRAESEPAMAHASTPVRQKFWRKRPIHWVRS